MTTATTTPLPMLLEEVEVVSVERLSPSFVRLELGGAALAELGPAGPSLDQRMKLIFPHPGRPLPSLADAGPDWYAAWSALPDQERGAMRTYTLRAVRGTGEQTRMVVDFVLHADGAQGAHGPGGDFAATARAGNRVILVAPRRGQAFGGIEFLPGQAERLVLVGDETALPAIAAVLEQLPCDARGAAFLEVPVAGDVLPLERPAGIEVTWLPREHAERGAALRTAVLAHLQGAETAQPPSPVARDDVGPDLWETPAYSSSGEPVCDTSVIASRWDGCYFWIAGESRVVTGLRRDLVRDLGVDRRQVAFMGYWREGVAMKG